MELIPHEIVFMCVQWNPREEREWLMAPPACSFAFCHPSVARTGKTAVNKDFLFFSGGKVE